MNARHDMITMFVVRPDASGRSQEFLQLRRVIDDYMGGTWQIVRGGVEPGENVIHGALRELREETGLIPRELYRLSCVESFYTPVDDTLWHSVAFCAIVGRSQEVVLNHEHDALRWIARDQMDRHLMWASERQLLSDLCRDILDNGPAKPFLVVEMPPSSVSP
jgi:8-oxo-dGTP pyrophosphatase MutT (NUDIX family)